MSARSEGYWIVCDCGNEPHWSGFYPVNKDTHHVDWDHTHQSPDGSVWYWCASCDTVYDLPDADYVGPLNAVDITVHGITPREEV